MLGNLQINLRSHLTSSGSSFRGRPRFTGFDDPDTRVGKYYVVVSKKDPMDKN